MTRRKRLGIFFPNRPENHLKLNLHLNPIGGLLDEIRLPLLQTLRDMDHIELVENLNFQTAHVQNGKVYCGDFCLNDLDRFAWYCDINRQPGSFPMEVLRTLNRDVEVVRNPDRVADGYDKYRSHIALRDAGVRVPEFVLFDHRVPHRMADILDKWGAGVLKPRRGGWGKGVTLIDSAERLRDVIGYVGSTGQDGLDRSFFLEQYIENDPRRWSSLTMINGEVTQAYRKKIEKFQDFGNGMLKVEDIDEVGGGVVLADVTPQHLEEAHKAYDALGLGLIGFDMIWTEEGPVVVDENTCPGNYPELYREERKEPAKMLANWVTSGL